MATQYSDLSMPDLCRAYKTKLNEVLEDETAQAAIDEMELEFQERNIPEPYIGQIDMSPYEVGSDDYLALRAELSLQEQINNLKLQLDAEKEAQVRAAAEEELNNDAGITLVSEELVNPDPEEPQESTRV